jgi:CheY-like chemotaxis protein
MKVLIADDVMDNQLLMESHMKNLGWEYKIVNNGLQAINACKNEHFDAIIMDIRMPVLDGIEAAKYIRVLNKVTPIIALTAYMSEIIKNQCDEAEMNALIEKPSSFEEIKNVIITLVGFVE